MKKRIFPIVIYSIAILLVVFIAVMAGMHVKKSKGSDSDKDSQISASAVVNPDKNSNDSHTDDTGLIDVSVDKTEEIIPDASTDYYETDKDALITRYGFLALMQKKFGLQPSQNGKSSFSDVPDKSKYADVVIAATEGGLIDADGEPFRGTEYITGREAALILMRYIGPIKVMSATGKQDITDELYLKAAVDYDVILSRRLDEKITVEQAADIIDNGVYFMGSEEANKTVVDVKIKTTTRQIDESQIMGIARDYSVLKLYKENSRISKGDYISFPGIDGSIMGKKVTYVDGTLIGLETCSADEVFDSYKVQCVVPATLVGINDAESVATPIEASSDDSFFAVPCSIQDSVKVSNGFAFSFAYNSSTKEEESLADTISCTIENFATGWKETLYVEAKIFDTLNVGVDITLTDIYCVIEADLVSLHPYLSYSLQYDATVGGTLSLEYGEDDFYYPYVSIDVVPDSLKDYVTVEAGLCFSYEVSGKFGVDTYWKDCVSGFKYYLLGGITWPILEANLTDFDWYVTGKASVYPIKLNAKVSVGDVVAYAGIGAGVSLEVALEQHVDVTEGIDLETTCFDVTASYPEFKFVGYLEGPDLIGKKRGGLSFEEHYALYSEGFHIENWKIVDKCSYGKELNLLAKTEAGKRTEEVKTGEVKLVEPTIRAAYADYMQKLMDEAPQGVQYAMSLEDVNGDYIPELFYAKINSETEDKVHVLSFDFNGIVEMGETGVAGSVRFSPGHSVFSYDRLYEDYKNTYIQRLDSDSKIVDRMLIIDYSDDVASANEETNSDEAVREEYYIAGTKVDTSVYMDFVNELENEGAFDNSYCLWSWDLAYPVNYKNLLRLRNNISLVTARDESILDDDEYIARKAYRKYMEKIIADRWHDHYGDWNYTTVAFNFYDFDMDGITELYYIDQPLGSGNPKTHICRYDMDTCQVIELNNKYGYVADESSVGYIEVLPESNSFRVVNYLTVGEPDVYAGSNIIYYTVDDGKLNWIAIAEKNASGSWLRYMYKDEEVTREQFISVVRDLGYDFSEGEILKGIIDVTPDGNENTSLYRLGVPNYAYPAVLDNYVNGLLETVFDATSVHYTD